MSVHLHQLHFVIGFSICLGLLGCSNFVPRSSDSLDLPTISDQTQSERRSRLRLDLASAYFENGQSEIALDEIKQALSIYAPLADAYNLRGLIYASMAMNDLAKQNFKKAIQLSPKNARFWHNQAWFYCQIDQLNEARTFFEKAIQLSTPVEIAKTWLAYGICEAKAHNWNRAESLLVLANERDPNNVMSKLNFAEVLYQLHKFDRALKLVTEIKHNLSYKDSSVLWLEWRVQKKIGNDNAAKVIASEIQLRFPNSPEYTLLNTGRY